MSGKCPSRYLLLLLLAATVCGGNTQMKPFTMDWQDNENSLVDVSFLLDAPAGKDGFMGTSNGHLTKPDGGRFRIWGINFTGASCFPSKKDAPVVAEHLARFGINCVRFHFLDSNWSASVFIKGRDDTRALDKQQLDRWDFFIAELKKRGIYTNINLNVGRNYRKGDGVKDYEYLGLAKVVNYFDRRVQELHREYAEQLLTHYNPYTKSQYRYEPAVATIELVNENSIVEAWFSDRLLGKNTRKHPGTWTDITKWYADQLTDKYNAWLVGRLSRVELAELRQMAGVGEDDPVPRLTRNQFANAPRKRFHLEATFYMELEQDYFKMMYDFLKKELGVKSLIAGTSDHNHGRTGYPLLTSTSRMDIVDGHVYWQHPSYGTDPKTKRRTFSIRNTPMVNDPFNSTVVQLSRSAVAGKPYTVSETNHPFPSEYACEGIAILAAYAAFHDWDGIYLYTFEHKNPEEWGSKVPGHFDIRPDPVKMSNIAACAAMFLRSDVRPALETVRRSYSAEQVREGIRLPYSERSYFTAGFSLAIPLRHATRIGSFDDDACGQHHAAGRGSPTISDTGELAWYHSEKGKAFVTVETDKSQALIGFVKGCGHELKNLSATVENEFCSIILTSVDGRPISGSGRLLLVTTARSANSGMVWNEKSTTLSNWGSAPTVIESVKGKIILRNLEPARQIVMIPMDSGGKPLGDSVSVRAVRGNVTLPVGEQATTWYLISIQR
ncbi:MAG: hypothetical protein JSW59_10195 [Phycisphaerales bacterium]|nr:MAG: hypothetical protein JSW59_10195 [Phycisphaerales bacterium]